MADMEPGQPMEFPLTKPLPPIGSKSANAEKSQNSETDHSQSIADDDNKSTKRVVPLVVSKQRLASTDKSAEGSSKPRVIRGFRPEALSDEEMEKQKEARAVSFSDNHSVPFKKKTYDGREILFVTLDTQTDWEWVEKNEIMDAMQIGPDKTSSPDVKEMASPKPGSRADGHEEKSSPSPASIYMPYSDEYGIPILDLSSDTDDSSDEEVSHKKVKDERAFMPSIGPPNILQYQRESEKQEIPVQDPDSRILDYDFDKDDSGVPYGMFSGNCEFCSKPIKPFPTMEQQLTMPPETLYCCNDYREFVEFVLTTSKELEEQQMKQTQMIDIKPHEHVGSKQERNAAKEKAVQRMRERELQRRAQEASGMQNNFFASPSKMVFMKIPGGLGNVTMKDLFDVQLDPFEIHLDCLDMCPLRAKSRELEQRGQGGDREGKEGPGKGYEGDMKIKATQVLIDKGHCFECKMFQTAQIASIYQQAKRNSSMVARQMKTINYQLSSQKCLDEGWTVRAPSPFFDDLGDDVFTPEPLNPAMLADGKLRDRPLIEKFYESGQKFLTMFPDGTGNVFYPSGNLAILISSVKLGQYNYTIHHDYKLSGVAAVFEPNGYGYCYFPNGDIRLYIDQYGGLELDNVGAKRRKWSWKDQLTHVHAPPFQPICIGLNRHMGVRLMSQDNIALTFSASKRSCRFNMGSRLRLVAPENAPLKEVDEEQIFLEEKKNTVEMLLNKVANLLKFPNNPKLDKMLPPQHVTSNQVKTERLKMDRKEYLSQRAARDKKQSSISVDC
ncbi:glutamate-rich protein 6-like isoform X14 [Dreissena polymorpha]|uniref:glutamate-rich protein 6-like isoform X14 n=1 Tax=Dreissena polymorpha TaxID=45954 RepID=UPI002264546C|nr:glutamate-rich protein 6-like isoform X14 [Dreissena polymorpha]